MPRQLMSVPGTQSKGLEVLLDSCFHAHNLWVFFYPILLVVFSVRVC